jgi:hypothetical protein
VSLRERPVRVGLADHPCVRLATRSEPRVSLSSIRTYENALIGQVIAQRDPSVPDGRLIDGIATGALLIGQGESVVTLRVTMSSRQRRCSGVREVCA